MNQPIPRADIERFTAQLAEKRRRMAKAEHCVRGYRDENGVWQGGLLSFVRYFWHVLEPGTPFVDGAPLEAICEHLEAVTFGEITNVLMNVPPGFSKSLITNCFWPAWEWGPMDLAHIRYVTFSYSSSLTERDNGRFRDLLISDEYRLMYPAVVLRQTGNIKISNTKHGWKLASSVGGVGTGQRGDRIICFPAGEMVHTEFGLMSIGDIVELRLSVRVYSLNTATGEVSLQPVVGWHQNPASDLVKVTLSDGSNIRCTPSHRIWNGSQWTEASHLKPGTALPVICQTQPFRYVSPIPPYSDALDCTTLNPIALGKHISIFHALGDFPHLILSKGNAASAGQKSPMFTGIVNVLFSSAVFQIIGSAIKRMSVFVNFEIFPRNSGLHDLASVHHLMGALGMAGPVGINRLPLSAVNDAREAAHTPQAGNPVNPLKTDDCPPFLAVQDVNADGHADFTYCLAVQNNHTFCVGSSKGLYVANCDDGNNVKESESKAVLEETNRWFRESMSSRLNNMETGAKVVIAQRVAENDISGTILELGLPYVHLMIPMEFEWQADEKGQPYATEIGWIDPRWRPTPEECNGELAWPERFSGVVVQRLKRELGPYATAAQLQQTPEARGGGIFKREWWQVWDPPDGKFPPFSYIVASLDGAFTSKEENDPSALTLWGIFENEMGYNRAMLIHAWSKKLPFSGPKVDVLPGEHDSVYRRRAMPHWGLIEWVADTCNRFKADRLLIENKGPGISAAQSLSNSHGRSGWAIELAEPKGDKVARAIAVQPTFSQQMVYAPDREWADATIDEMAVFPKGRHDDRVDSATQAIKHLRDNGILRSDEERRAEEIEAVTHKSKQRKGPRYPGMRAV